MHAHVGNDLPDTRLGRSLDRSRSILYHSVVSRLYVVGTCRAFVAICRCCFVIITTRVVVMFAGYCLSPLYSSSVLIWAEIYKFVACQLFPSMSWRKAESNIISTACLEIGVL